MRTVPRLPLLVDPHELAGALDDPQVVVLDATVRLERPAGGGPYAVVSGRDAYREAHVPGAAFADVAGDLADPAAPHPFALPSAERFAAGAGALGVGSATHVVVYAQESPMWATRLWWLFRAFGFDAVSVLDGGLPAWRAAGLDVRAGDEHAPGRTFVARPRPALLATRDDVERIVASGGACLVNALRPEVFRGEGASSYSRPGRIPGSVNVPWTGLVDPATNRFRPPAEIATLLESGGARADEPLVAYCGGGISATVDLFALALVGRTDARLYDGSLAEWTADPALPVAVGPA